MRLRPSCGAVSASASSDDQLPLRGELVIARVLSVLSGTPDTFLGEPVAQGDLIPTGVFAVWATNHQDLELPLLQEKNRALTQLTGRSRDRLHCHRSSGARQLQRCPGPATPDLRGSGGHRDRERPPVPRRPATVAAWGRRLSKFLPRPGSAWKNSAASSTTCGARSVKYSPSTSRPTEPVSMPGSPARPLKR
jgi:hypothetical protein